MPQSFAQIYIHIVFSTKCRHPFLVDETVAKKVRAYIVGIAINLHCNAIQVGGMPDHIHLLCSLSRQKTVADLVRTIKINSTKWIKSNIDGMQNFHWQDGYGVFSVSRSQRDDVIQYIVTQKEHHTKSSFQDEFRLLLKRHEIEWDEKYVWD
ncbi:MAG: IS200/IS605 family transposase [Planctomycetaceae bacterium]|jgi:REP element-mobilizing transposase RayT|nr:IS200/IS605 family transposase [Planctomycetaceae bacterium]